MHFLDCFVRLWRTRNDIRLISDDIFQTTTCANTSQKPRGFTLIEMILTIIVVGIIAGVSAKILMSGIDTYSFVVNRKDATQHARVAMERMADELTLVRTSDITYMSNTRLSFIDRQGFASSFKSGSLGGIPVILRGDDFLAGRLGFLDFDYLRENDTSALLISQIRKINVELFIEALGGYGSVTLRTEVFPRNRMYTEFSTF